MKEYLGPRLIGLAETVSGVASRVNSVDDPAKLQRTIDVLQSVLLLLKAYQNEWRQQLIDGAATGLDANELGHKFRMVHPMSRLAPELNTESNGNERRL
jgi:hypothetical protein